MELIDNPLYTKIKEKEQLYSYLKLLFEDLEVLKNENKSLKFQNEELKKNLLIFNMRIKKLEDRLDGKK